MKLYRHPERIFNELEANGHGGDSPLRVEEMTFFDQYHYLGTDAVDNAIHSLNMDSKKKIIEIGSGIGGPARYLAEKTGSHVTALELQHDLHNVACSLTERCGLSHTVEHLCGDILDFPEVHTNFDFVVSWLTFLHIPDRASLLKKCYNILKPDGKMFIEDFCKCGEFNENEKELLSRDVYCDYLPTFGEYKNQLTENGFAKVKLSDKTAVWRDFVKDRMENFVENRNRHMEIHNTEIVEELIDFYENIFRLFDGGNLGGVSIVAEKGADHRN